jgi:hypothetical protein
MMLAQVARTAMFLSRPLWKRRNLGHMRQRIRTSHVIPLIVLVLTPVVAFAWNGTGHKAIALIAYEHLTPTARQRVNQLLSKHPDYPKWTDGVPARQRGSTAFLAASLWPDQIRNDPRFHDDNRPSTPPIPGLPAGAQARHAGWHFINIPFSPDGTPTIPAEVPNILTKLKDFESVGTMPEPMQVYLLPWIIHLIGDVHQPLHVINRFTRDFPKGDAGGNRVRLTDGSELHAYWDSRLGTSEGPQYIDELTATIEQMNPKPRTLDMQPEHWVNEGFELRKQVYNFSGRGTPGDPAVLNDQYSVQARLTALQRAALAAYRLAEFLNHQFD